MRSLVVMKEGGKQSPLHVSSLSPCLAPSCPTPGAASKEVGLKQAGGQNARPRPGPQPSQQRTLHLVGA